jgi:hypothetical protein
LISRRLVIAASAVSLLGLAFCLANLFGADLLCVTEGCALYHDYRILGLNLYFVGAAGFFVLALLLCVSLQRDVTRWLLLVVAGGLVIETLLLAYQYLFWVCSSCLVAALLFGLAALLAVLAFPALRRKSLYALGGLWLVFVLFVSLAVAKETLFRPWSLFGGGGEIQVYFSPTCPRCREVVSAILDRYPHLERVAFIPVSKGKEDDRRLAATLPLLRRPEGNRKDLRRLFEPPEQGSRLPVLGSGDRFRLLVNRVCLAARGFTTIPQIISPFPLELAPALSSGGPQPAVAPDPFDQGQRSCSPLFDGGPCP